MYVKKVTYVDYDDVERTETFMFNLSKAELTMMQMEEVGGLEKRLQKLIETHNTPQIMNTFRDLLHRSYGEKSPDGKRFVKSEELATAFEQTEAYSQIFMELCTDAEAAAEFIASVVPKDIAAEIKKAEAAMKANGEAPALTVTANAAN